MATFRELANGFLSRAPRPEIDQVKDLDADGPAGAIPMRLYRPSAHATLPVVLFIHGGGFVFGDLDTHDALCRTLALQSGMAVAAVDYRLAPEHPYPAALDDCHAALRWLAANADALGLDAARIGLGGDSAGGQLAVATALKARDRGPPLRHLALLYPLVDPHCASASMTAFGQDYMLTRAFLEWSWAAYAATGAKTDPFVQLAAADLAGAPPTTIITAGYDPLCDEGRDLAERLASAGVRVSAHHFPDMIHGFAGLPIALEAADRAIGLITRAMRESMISGAVAST